MIRLQRRQKINQDKRVNELQVQLPPEVPTEEAKLLLACKLYETGRLSLEQAATLAGFFRRAFMELLGKHGVALYDYPAEDLEREMNA